MGDRLNVEFKFTETDSVHLYAHWAGSRILGTSFDASRKNLAQALENAQGRLGDKTYYSRIVMSQLIGEDWSQNLSWGIAPYYIDSEYSDVVIDMTDMGKKWFLHLNSKSIPLNKDTDYGVILND